MNEVWRSKFGLGTFLTTITVTLSYEIKDPSIKVPAFILVFISFLISTYLANILIEKAMDWRWGRKLILGKAWLEGAWYLSTTTLDNNSNAISQLGICYISYEGRDHVLTVTTYRKKYHHNMHTGFSSVSEFVSLRGSDKKFCNLFVLSNGEEETRGITTGTFISDGRENYPNNFEGHVTLFNERVTRRQTATKIPDSVVKRLMIEHGGKWRDECLRLAKDLPQYADAKL